MWADFKPFFVNEDLIWKETVPLLDGSMYPSVNDLDQKDEKNVSTIALLVSAKSRDRKTYANLATTVASLTTKLGWIKKNLIETLSKNPCFERLLGQIRIDSQTIRKRVHMESS